MAKLFLTLTILCVFGCVLGKGSIKWSHIMEFVGNIEECKGEVGATDSDFDKIFKIEPPTTKEAKCLYSCFMKKYELMDDNGKLSKESALSYLEYLEKLPQIPDEINEMATKVIENCSEIDVSDDDCEAAVQYGKCFIEEAIAQYIEKQFKF